MLLTYMFALCLRIDDFATDAELIAHDLSMPTLTCVTWPSSFITRANDFAFRVNTLFKTLGTQTSVFRSKLY